jgi:hypothetical protein
MTALQAGAAQKLCLLHAQNVLRRERDPSQLPTPPRGRLAVLQAAFFCGMRPAPTPQKTALYVIASRWVWVVAANLQLVGWVVGAANSPGKR